MNIFFLKEEEQEIKKLFNFENYNFVSATNVRELSCDILFVLNKSNLRYFIRGEINNNILETINIDYIVINDVNTFNLIKDNFDKIIDTKIEESYLNGEKNKSLYRFFRIGENKLYSIVRNFKNFYYIEDPQGQHTSIDGKKCRKCTDYFLDGVNHYEKDINLMTRYSLEKVKYNKIRVGKNYRVVNFDIETLASVDAVNVPEPLIAIAAHDNFTNELKYWEIRDLDENKEKEMLEDFFKYVSKFDIISGFNITKFDIPYLINRAIKVGADTSLITGIKNSFPSCKYRGKEEISPWFNVIPGISIVDLMGLAEKSIGYLDVKLPDKKLDTLGKYILGESKVEVATPAILFRTKEFEKLKEYTLQDVNIAVKLDEKLGLIELLLATIEIVPGINIDAAVWNSKIIDFYLLSKFSNIVMPSVVKGREKNIKGATVFETISGIHDNVGVFDVAGMYPALIRTFNISPDTKDQNGDIILDKTRFISNKKGILTKLVDDFTELRSYYKKQKKLHEKDKDYKLWQLKEFTVKKILASTYGVFGYVNFRFFDNDIANAITFAGRELLEHMKKISELEGYVVISGDTDSVFIRKADDSEADFENLNIIINDSLNQWVKKYTNIDEVANNHKILIEYETLFHRVIFTTAKKKYMGLIIKEKGRLLDEPKFYGKGNELMRKDTPAGMKEELRKIIMTVLKNSDKSKNIEIIKNRVKEIKTSIKNWTTDDLIIYKEINRDFDSYKVKPIHVRGALNSNKYLGTTFSRQDYKGGYVFVKSRKHPEADILFMNEQTKLNEDFIIDYNKYFQKFILDKILLIFGEHIYKEVIRRDNLITRWL